MTLRVSRLCCCLLIWLALSPALPAAACTLWAAAGERVAGGGVLIAKNRDWRDDCRQELRRYRPRHGFRCFGLYAKCRRTRGLMAGVNEKGLVVVSATAPYPRAERLAGPRTRGLNRKLLMSCAGVEQVLSRHDLLRGPRILLLADPSRIALVEIAKQGLMAVRVLRHGVLMATNHYGLPFTRRLNPHLLSPSSLARRWRIAALLRRPGRFSLADFLAISRDRNQGRPGALWREPDWPGATRTLASWVVRLKPGGNLELVVRYYPCPGGGRLVERRFTRRRLFPDPPDGPVGTMVRVEKISCDSSP